MEEEGSMAAEDGMISGDDSCQATVSRVFTEGKGEKSAMEWKRFFASHILDRGYDYYCEGAVEELEISGDFVRAEVIGSEVYEVEISLEDGEVDEMYCSCPYAEDGRNCKHMAAVLFEWEERKESGLLEETFAEEGSGGNFREEALFSRSRTAAARGKRAEAIRELVAEAEVSLVRSYLASVLEEDEKLLLRFYALAGEKGTDEASVKEEVARYKKQVDGVARRYLGPDAFIHYREANGFVSELGEILEEAADSLMEREQYRGVFALANEVFLLLGSVDIDDSDGETGILSDRIYELWQELLERAGKAEKQEMFDWFASHLDGSVVDYLKEKIEQILAEGFAEEEFAGCKASLIRERVEKARKKERGWSRDYELGKWAVRYLNFLKQQGAGREEQVNFCRECWESSSVRRYYTDLCVQAKDYGEALKTLDESIVLDREYRGLVIDYQGRKKELYRLTGDREAYVAQLWKLVLEDKAGDLELYRELKKQYSGEEWVMKREELFQKLPSYASGDKLYREEGLYDRLLAFVLERPGFSALQEYAGVLKKDYSEQLVQKYREELEKMAAFTGDRRKYQQLTSLLRELKKLSGGSQAAVEIADGWKVRYRNRPAMMDELRKWERAAGKE